MKFSILLALLFLIAGTKENRPLLAQGSMLKCIDKSRTLPIHNCVPDSPPDRGAQLSATKEYSLAELVSIAEEANPMTRAAWERAIGRAEALGIERSALFPALSFVVASGDLRAINPFPKPLKATRLERVAHVLNAKTQLERTRVVAPFDALVTNLNISQGAYAHAGTPVFTLIDVSRWYVIANFRESTLRHIRQGDRVEIYLMGKPDQRFTGTVESIGNGVLPEDGKMVDGLPDISRTLNWVHLAARFPVRIRVQNPDPSLFRIGATAVTIVRE